MNQEAPRYTEADFAPLPPDSLEADVVPRKPTTYAKDVWRNFLKRKTAVASLMILAALVFFVLFGPLMTEYSYYGNDYTMVNSPPSSAHWFGTDTLGRDLWTRVWVGGRVSLLLALLATIIPYAIGMIVGGISGYFGGKLDQVIMRVIDILMGIPPLIYMILLMVILGSGNMMTLVLTMSLTGWMGAARMTRGLVLQLKFPRFRGGKRDLGRLADAADISAPPPEYPRHHRGRHDLDHTLGHFLRGLPELHRARHQAAEPELGTAH